MDYEQSLPKNYEEATEPILDIDEASERNQLNQLEADNYQDVQVQNDEILSNPDSQDRDGLFDHLLDDQRIAIDPNYDDDCRIVELNAKPSSPQPSSKATHLKNEFVSKHPPKILKKSSFPIDGIPGPFLNYNQQSQNISSESSKKELVGTGESPKPKLVRILKPMVKLEPKQGMKDQATNYNVLDVYVRNDLERDRSLRPSSRNNSTSTEEQKLLKEAKFIVLNSKLKSIRHIKHSSLTGTEKLGSFLNNSNFHAAEKSLLDNIQDYDIQKISTVRAGKDLPILPRSSLQKSLTNWPSKGKSASIYSPNSPQASNEANTKSKQSEETQLPQLNLNSKNNKFAFVVMETNKSMRRKQSQEQKS